MSEQNQAWRNKICDSLGAPSCVPKSLKTSEWLFFFSFLFLFASFYMISKVSSGSDGLSVEKELPLIVVEVAGCVYKPGVFKIPQGSLVQEVIRKARPKPLADLSAIEMVKILDQECVIDVPVFKEIIVSVTGCVTKREELTLPAGARVCDLKKHLVLTQDADSRVFKSKKLLRNRQVIVVPKKKLA